MNIVGLSILFFNNIQLSIICDFYNWLSFRNLHTNDSLFGLNRSECILVFLSFVCEISDCIFLFELEG